MKTVKIMMDAGGLKKHFGFTPNQLSLIEVFGVKIEATSTTLTFTATKHIPQPSKPLKETVTMPPGFTGMLATGIPHDVKVHVQDVFTKLVSCNGTFNASQLWVLADDYAQLGKLGLTSEDVNAPTTVKSIPAVAAPPSKPTIQQGTKLPKVALIQATALGQPVAGTSQTAVYRVVALGPTIKMAAKVETGKLSLRIEGAASTFATLLQSLGFTKHDNYWSTHMAIGTLDPARVVGGVLLSMPKGAFVEQVVNRGELQEAFVA